MEGAEQTTDLLGSLGSFLRYHLDKFSKIVTIGDEVENVRDYFYLQSRRLGDRVRYEIQDDERAHASMIPCFIIQPLVENSIIHGVGKYVSDGNKMGEGWLLTGEMLELIHAGVNNIICTQPFGCLPNHIVGKGMIRAIRGDHPQANIVAIDYDPGATRTNQENRIKLMLAVAREKMNCKKNAARTNIP